MAVSDEELAARIAEHDEYFCRMVNLVPASLYIHKDEPDVNAKYFKNKRLAAPQQVKKEESKKGKKVKFDPANMKSVTDIQKERAEKEKQEKLEREMDMQGDEEEEEEDDDNGMEEDDDEGEEEEEEEEEETLPTDGQQKSAANGVSNGKVPRGPLSLVGTTPRAKSIEELKERLRLKIEEARAKRGTPEGGSRRQKKEDARNRNSNKQIAGAKGGRPDQAKGHQATALPAIPRPSEQALDIQFGKINVPGQVGRKKVGGKNLPGLLKKAEEKEKRLKELQKSEEGKDDANAILWQDAMKQAHGEKVLDNAKLLKKTIKRKQKQKEKSAKKWEARTAVQEAAGKERQQKREANLKKRKAGPGSDSAASGTAGNIEGDDAGGKKQRRAGFEGRRYSHEFLNKGKSGEEGGEGAAGGRKGSVGGKGFKPGMKSGGGGH